MYSTENKNSQTIMTYKTRPGEFLMSYTILTLFTLSTYHKVAYKGLFSELFFSVYVCNDLMLSL